MKFLCPQCKAKYRIADDKLAQRNSSRMKCRKCGHIIDIHAAAVPESIRPPGAPEPSEEDEDGRASAAPSEEKAPEAPAPATAMPAPAVPKAKATATPAPVPPAAKATATPAPAPRASKATATPAPVAPSAAGKAGPSPGAKALAPPPRRTSGESSLGPKRPGTGTVAPAPKRPGTGTVAPAPKRAVAPPRRGGMGAAAVAEKAAPAVAEPPAPVVSDAKPASESAPAPAEQPAPPSRRSVPPAKAAPAAPPRDEFEDDAPTRIHDGAALAAAFSSALDPGVVSAATGGTTTAVEEWYIGIDGSPIGPLTFAQLREKASSGAANPESLVWRDGFEEWKPLREFPELVALVEEAKKPAAAAPAPVAVAAVPAVLPEPVIMFPKAAPAPAEEGRVHEQSIIARLHLEQLKPHVSHRMAWAGLVVALALGVTIGAVLLSKTDTKEVVKYVEVPASAKPEEKPAPEAPQTLDEATVQAANTKKSGSSTRVDPTPAPAAPAKGLSGLSGLSGLNGLGPSTQGPDVAQAAAPGGQLDGASISRVVSNFTPSVRRGCWDPALVSRSPEAPMTARVSVSITIAPSGNVESVTTGGDPKGYPNLAHCIESKVRGWKFPRSSGTTTANVPFVFAAQ